MPVLAGPGQAYMRLCQNKDFASSLQKKKRFKQALEVESAEDPLESWRPRSKNLVLL
jgi:hypothetical protein